MNPKATPADNALTVELLPFTDILIILLIHFDLRAILRALHL